MKVDKRKAEQITATLPYKYQFCGELIWCIAVSYDGSRLAYFYGETKKKVKENYTVFQIGLDIIKNS